MVSFIYPLTNTIGINVKTFGYATSWRNKKCLINFQLRRNLTRPQVFEATRIPTMALIDWEIKKEKIAPLNKAGLLAGFYGCFLWNEDKEKWYLSIVDLCMISS